MFTTKRKATTCLLAACFFSLAAAPSTRGRERAAERLVAATAEHVRILTELQSRLPEVAKADLTKAMESASAGHETAVAAVGNTAPDTARASGSKPATVGLEKAREQVAASFEKSRTTLEGVMARVPEQAAEAVSEALSRIEVNRAAALERFDRLVAGERPGKPERLEKPDRPDKPERPEQPERVERPERPERPEPPRP